MDIEERRRTEEPDANGWRCEQLRGDTWMPSGNADAIQTVVGGDVFWRRGRYAYGDTRGGGYGAAVIESHYNYPGSPPPAFGMTSPEALVDYQARIARWPHVKVTLSLPTGGEDVADRFVEAMKIAVAKFMDAEGLTVS